MSSRRLLFLLLLVGFAVLFFFPTLIGLLTDWWWFQEIGYRVGFAIVGSLMIFTLLNDTLLEALRHAQ